MLTTPLGPRAAALAAMMTALPSLAAAQGYGPPPRPAGPVSNGPQADAEGFWPRGGLYGGIGVGLGAITFDCDFCAEASNEGFAFHGDLGWRVTPRIGVFADVYTIFATGFEIVSDFGVDDAVLGNTVVTFGGQAWVLPQVWIKGGIGAAGETFYTELEEFEGDEGPAFMIAAGYEVMSSPTMSIDLELRAGVGLYDEETGGTSTNASLDISINFHQILIY
jgi:hypothetical protein